MVVPPEFLRSLTKRLGVSDSELEVLLNTLEGEDLSAIAQRLGVQRNALQKRLGEVYKKFRIEGAGPGKFAKLQKIILEEYQKQVHHLQKETEKSEKNHIDWGEAPVVGTFFGRTTELRTLQQYLREERCPLVALLGMGGIGKSAIATRLVEKMADDYDYIIWRNLALRSRPTLETLLRDLIACFRHSQQVDTTSQDSPLIADFIQELRTSRCLVILDNFESLFQTKNFASYYQPGYENYGEFLKQVAQTRHQSSVLLLSRETPLELMALAGDELPTRVMKVKGLAEPTVRELLNQKGIAVCDLNVLYQLMTDYSGHPVAINQLITTVQTLFDGYLGDLLEENTIFVGEMLAQYFTEQLQRLSVLEQQVIDPLAVATSGLTLKEIQSQLPEINDLSYVMTALNSLNRRCLLEKLTENQITRFTLIPTLKKYVTLERLI